jgi:hypothetical protein
MRWNSRRSGSGPSLATASPPLDEISCCAEEPARINGVMASSETAAIPRPRQREGPEQRLRRMRDLYEIGDLLYRSELRVRPLTESTVPHALGLSAGRRTGQCRGRAARASRRRRELSGLVDLPMLLAGGGGSFVGLRYARMRASST